MPQSNQSCGADHVWRNVSWVTCGWNGLVPYPPSSAGHQNVEWTSSGSGALLNISSDQGWRSRTQEQYFRGWLWRVGGEGGVSGKETLWPWMCQTAANSLWMEQKKPLLTIPWLVRWKMGVFLGEISQCSKMSWCHWKCWNRPHVKPGSALLYGTEASYYVKPSSQCYSWTSLNTMFCESSPRIAL